MVSTGRFALERFDRDLRLIIKETHLHLNSVLSLPLNFSCLKMSEATNNHYWRSLSYLSYYLLIWTTGQEITSDCKDPIDIMIEFTGISLRHFVPFTFSSKKSSNKCCPFPSDP